MTDLVRNKSKEKIDKLLAVLQLQAKKIMHLNSLIFCQQIPLLYLFLGR